MKNDLNDYQTELSMLLRAAVKGTSLEGCEVEVLIYDEDDETTVAVDLSGRVATLNAESLVLKAMRNAGLSQLVKFEGIPAREGLRIYAVRK